MDNSEEELDEELPSLNMDQIREIMTYPPHWRNTLTESALKGNSIKDTYEELKDLENFM